MPWQFGERVSVLLPMQMGGLVVRKITRLLKECCRDCNLWLGLHSTSGCLRVLQSRHQGSEAKQAGTQAAASRGRCSMVRGPSNGCFGGRTVWQWVLLRATTTDLVIPSQQTWTAGS